MSRTLNGWPILTLAGITCAVLLGIAVSMIKAAGKCLLGFDDLGPRTDTAERDPCA